MLVEADGSVRLDEVLPELAGVAAADLQRGPLAAVVDGRFVPVTDELDAAGLRDGSVVVIGPRGELTTADDGSTDSLVELRIVSGPDAGAVAPAWRGSITIGSAPDAGLRIDDGIRVRPIELVVDIETADAVTVRAAAETTTALLDGAPINPEAVPWPLGGQIELAGRLIELAAPDLGDAALQPSADGAGLDYNRPPRILPPESATALRLPAPPPEMPARPLPILAALTPLAMAAGSAIVFHSYFFLLIAGLSPLIMVVNHVTSKRRGRTSKRAQLAAYREHKETIEAEAQEALVQERTELLRSSPDAAALAEIATRPLPRLWERRGADPDHLRLRLGTATQPSRVTLDDPEQLEHRRRVTWDARDAPAVVQLAERGVIGIAGWGDRPRRLAQWAVAQIGVLQSPRDVRVYLLTDSAGRDAWGWIGWLPHTRPGFGQDTMATIGVTAASTARRIAELGALIAARRAALGRGDRWTGDEVVVVIDGARRLRSMPGFVQILKEGPAVGIYSICVDSEERLLPEECTAVAIVEPEGVVIRQQRVDVLSGIRPDLVDDGWFDRVARAVAPIRDASPQGDDGTIPASSRLLDVLRLEPPTADDIEAGWLLSPRSTTAVIGESIDGPFSIDLRADGPHALIAGTTGSGKSELLQTLVATLAVANRPDEMNFVLVDYKGGAAFKDCVDLPHTVGMVTDLDAHLVERALESLGAELRTREQLLAVAGAKDLEDYLDLRGRTPTLTPIARLVIVIDEFASLARELPDFVRGLVNIAQRGRSLGIHLVLATQRPSGVVSPEIRANTNLRIALRVTDTAESSDVIDAPDAARIGQGTPAAPTCGSGRRRSCPSRPRASAVVGRGASRRARPRRSCAPSRSPSSPIPSRSRRRRIAGPGMPTTPICARWSARSGPPRAPPASRRRAARGCRRCRSCSRSSSCGPGIRRRSRSSPTASRTCPTSSCSRRPRSTSTRSATSSSSAPRGPGAARPCAPSARCSPRSCARATCTSTASTAATARCCRSPTSRTPARSRSGTRPSGCSACSRGCLRSCPGARPCSPRAGTRRCPSSAAPCRRPSGCRTSFCSSTSGRASSRVSATSMQARSSIRCSCSCARGRAPASTWS
ncbi:hypothetical protein GCM10025881_25700 [Pseudolysinimonas kribbensis]|uniref:FtsK domain-containing protein n=1 Tax=Pseudolysinimonas kribbensis TaxID=433641 RepID=A0ABQ6K7M6_9MICO|nr:hypothetical protein GCM10025881_25700 [Pseudolysinimonas kribbensis]